MIVVSNSSPLIALSSVDRLDLMQLLFELNLHAGESEAIALALERGIQGIILDDKQAREIAAELGLKVIGTLGLLILAKRKGFLSAVRPIMAQIIERVNFRIAPSVLNRALSLIDEPLLQS